ncbi:MAG TPA: hypothetical protein VM784_14970 [Actinomycetota bacterium]|nr:hypothetical protein [Actinomycetota bacterium]
MPRVRLALPATKRVALVLMVVGLVGACGSSPERYESAGAVAAAINDAGIRCEDFAITEDREETSGEHEALIEHESLVEEQGACAVDGESVTIRTFENEEARDDWVAVGEKVEGSLAVGPNWAVAGRSKALVEEIADALDAVPPDEVSSL